MFHGDPNCCINLEIPFTKTLPHCYINFSFIFPFFCIVQIKSKCSYWFSYICQDSYLEGKIFRSQYYHRILGIEKEVTGEITFLLLNLT